MSEARQSSLKDEARVLVLLDQPLIAEVVRLTLNHGRFVTRDARDSFEAVRIMAEWQPHLAVIDMELGGRPLFERMIGSGRTSNRMAVVGLTRRGDLKSKLDAFELGVDDIMTMPFSPEELLARVIAITRRTFGPELPLRPVLKLGELELDILNRRVLVDSEEVHLSGLEQSLLYLLAASAGQLVTRDQILDALWGADFIAGSNVVDRHVRNLRAKLGDDWRKPRFIATLAGRGYRFIPRTTEHS
jgi:two-component system, OmpR family, response regulator RegX3